MGNQSLSITLWRKLNSSSLGRWIFSRFICFKAPYFSTISPNIIRLEPGCCEAKIYQRRKIQNHLGTIHAIALCNLVELCGGLMVDVSVPNDMRWIPKGMKVKYLNKARGNITASAILEQPLVSQDEPYQFFVSVVLVDEKNLPVLEAAIEMWISKKK